MTHHNPVYMARRSFAPRVPWFAGMWEVGSWCEYSYYYDVHRHVCWVWGYGSPWEIRPADWSDDVRRAVSCIVCPD